MKLIPLTQGLFAQVDDWRFDELNKYKWYAWKPKGNTTHYARRSGNIRGQKVLMHRQIMGLTDPKILVDHADRYGLNCQEYNLRIATHSQNRMNRVHRKEHSSKYRGVTWDTSRNKWIVGIVINRKRFNLGRFSDEILAAKVYNEAAKIHHKEFAILNTFV